MPGSVETVAVARDVASSSPSKPTTALDMMRSGIYHYTPEQEMAARESLEKQHKLLNRKIVTEILPAKRFYRAEEYLEKGGHFGFRQSAEKGCNDPIHCYG